LVFRQIAFYELFKKELHVRGEREASKQRSSFASVHNDGLGHLVTGFLIPSQWSSLAGIPRRRNLDEVRFGFQSLFHASVDLGPETVG
jgi:hypothetical protein